MRHTSPLAAVAFDIDGTLYPNGRMYRASLPLVLRHISLFRAFGAARREIRSRHPIADLHHETIKLTAYHLGKSEARTKELVERVIYTQWEQVLTRVPLYPRVEETLAHFRERGLRLAAMSDFPVERKLEVLRLEGWWDAAFSSEEIGYLKPNPEPFRAISERLDLPAESILYVGNSYHYDVEGAAAIGFPTAHLARRRRGESIADLTFSRFDDLAAWVDERVAREHNRQNRPDD